MGDPVSWGLEHTWPPARSKRHLLLDRQGLGFFYDIFAACAVSRPEQTRVAHTIDRSAL